MVRAGYDGLGCWDGGEREGLGMTPKQKIFRRRIALTLDSDVASWALASAIQKDVTVSDFVAEVLSWYRTRAPTPPDPPADSSGAGAVTGLQRRVRAQRQHHRSYS